MRARISHIGSKPLSLPPSTSLKLLAFPPHPNPLRPLPSALAQSRTALVTGARGSVVVPVPSFCELLVERGGPAAAAAAAGAQQQGDGIASASTSSPLPVPLESLSSALSSLDLASPSSKGADKPKGASPAAAGDTAALTKIRIQVQDSSVKVQRAQWGLTRALLANAVHGVTEGHSLTLRMVGVGYRASVEADPFPSPDAIQLALERAGASSSSSSSPSDTVAGSNWYSRDQAELYRRLVDWQEGQGPASKSKRVPQRLNLRLGYSHPIVMPVPRGIECATPAPNRIVLTGNDKAALGLFASQIRRWRKPEPYKGKGIFVGDETIRLKTAKNK